MLFYNRMI